MRERDGRVLLISPPFTGTNAPFASVTHLAGYLRRHGIDVSCVDLGIDVLDRLFSRTGLRALADAAPAERAADWNDYASCIDEVMRFLRGLDPTVALLLSRGGLVPPRILAMIASDELPDSVDPAGHLQWTVEDWAKLVAGVLLRHIAGAVAGQFDDRFALTAFGESIVGRSTSFAEVGERLAAQRSPITSLITQATIRAVESVHPTVVGISVPFTGSVCGAIEVATVIRRLCPETRIVLGGGYVSTELRDLADPTVFEFFDYVVLDDGYEPLLRIVETCAEPERNPGLERTFVLDGGAVRWLPGSGRHAPHAETGPPANAGLDLSRYFPLVDTPNPVHRLWSDWRWNKLILAQGCYWRRCRFCDVHLDYVGRFERIPAVTVVNWMEHLIAETGRTGFHFVDEAMPPAALTALSEELLRRQLHTAWWGNVRFERSFTRRRVETLARAGCVAVTGGLETPVDRLLREMDKGITLVDAIRAMRAFAECGILVHAYLMYGYPGETLQETVDGCEIVRQLFEAGYLRGAHWHLFSMTKHSPLGRAWLAQSGPPRRAPGLGEIELPYSADHATAVVDVGSALRTSLAAFKRGVGLDRPVSSWFDEPVPLPSVAADFVRRSAAAP